MEYQFEAFGRLNAFAEAKASLRENRDRLTELGSVICKYGFEEHIGINLLHRHFDLRQGERLVRSYHDNRATMKPLTDSVYRPPYIWQLEDLPSGLQGLRPLEFLDPSGGTISESVVIAGYMLENSPDFVEEFGANLVRLGLDRTFGLIALNSDWITLAEDEILVETTDFKARRLTLSPFKRAEISDLDELTETVWSFKVDTDLLCDSCRMNLSDWMERKREKFEEWKRRKSIPAPVQAPGSSGEKPLDTCLNSCTNHCRNHCSSHCQSHCVSHG